MEFITPSKIKIISKTKIDMTNIFSQERLGVSDTVESGQSLTIGVEYKKSRKKN